jgi:hypothetical protein
MIPLLPSLLLSLSTIIESILCFCATDGLISFIARTKSLARTCIRVEGASATSCIALERLPDCCCFLSSKVQPAPEEEKEEEEEEEEEEEAVPLFDGLVLSAGEALEITLER